MTGGAVVELVLAGLFLLGAIRSMVVWIGRPYDSQRLSDHVIYALHLTARIGLWLAFAAAFAGFALLDEPQRFRWFGMVPIALGSVQLVTGLALSRRADPGSC